MGPCKNSVTRIIQISALNFWNKLQIEPYSFNGAFALHKWGLRLSQTIKKGSRENNFYCTKRLNELS